MDLLLSASQLSTVRFAYPPRCFSPRSRCRFPIVRSSLPFPKEKARYYRELEAAVDVVERACRLCVEVKAWLFSADGRVLEKNDDTPVTVADFGVQGLVSLELGKMFPSIPLVAEEDSAFLRLNNLSDTVMSFVNDSSRYQALTQDDVLEAIDRGGGAAFAFGSKPATYWILDPIDGTRGFVRGSEALFVVGLALVVEGQIVLGVMGCPNWEDSFLKSSTSQVPGSDSMSSRAGTIMVAHAGCGTWTKRLSSSSDSSNILSDNWTRCFVDSCHLVHEANFCIPESQTWESLPLSALFEATTNTEIVGDNQVVLVPKCCGSLCKYMMVASGRASVFILQARSQRTVKAWDHVVGMICVEEAGGKVTDWRGSEIDLAADQVERRIIFPSGGVLVTNGRLHSKIIEMISCNSSPV